MPETRSEEKRWSSEVRKRLPIWVSETVSPLIIDAISAQSLPATVRVEADKLFIAYEAVAGGSGYVAPNVIVINYSILRVASLRNAVKIFREIASLRAHETALRAIHAFPLSKSHGCPMRLRPRPGALTKTTHGRRRPCTRARRHENRARKRSRRKASGSSPSESRRSPSRSKPLGSMDTPAYSKGNERTLN